VKLDVLIKSGELKGDPDALASELVEVSDIGVWERKVFDFKPSEKCKLKIWLDRLPDKFERYGRWTSIDNHVGFSRPLDADVITTGYFTSDAKKRAQEPGLLPIELIDGEQLIKLMEEMELGLKPTYEVNHDFFDDFEAGKTKA
jgi:hypothetical protein